MEERTANYPGYRDESTMEVIRHESLGIYIYAKPKNQMEQKNNLNPYGKSRGDTLPSLRGYRQRALRFLRQGEDERRFPCLLQKTYTYYMQQLNKMIIENKAL